jgi:hypothetical protein
LAYRPDLRRFVADQIDMQFQDLRAVLRLPDSKALGTSAGGNFLATSALLSVICGSSTLFYDAGPEAFRHPFDSRRRFLGAMSYMPWNARDAGGMQHGQGRKRLWSYARNPLAHAFGVSYHPGKTTGTVPNTLRWSLEIAKRKFSLSEIHDLETSVERPEFAGPPLRRLSKDPERLSLNVGGLYWGTHRMLHGLLADPAQADPAEQMSSLLESASSESR